MNRHVADSTDSTVVRVHDGSSEKVCQRYNLTGNRPPHGDLVAKARHEVETSPPFFPGSVLVGHCSSWPLGVVSLDSPLVPRKSCHTSRGVLRDQRSRWHVWPNGVPRPVHLTGAGSVSGLRLRDAKAFDGADHDLSKSSRIKVRRGNPMPSLAVRFDPADLEQLRVRAEAEGLGATQLVGRWVMEHLDEPSVGGAVEDLVEGLEKSLKATRALKRSTGTRKAG